MSKTIYPAITAMQPLQTLIFKLENSMEVRCMLKPQPDASGLEVAHVDLDVVMAGKSQISGFGNPGQIWSVQQAAEHGYKFAQFEAGRVGTTIQAIHMEGEEFLEKSDLVQMVGSSIPVTVY